jgi:hypothetical protein
MTVVVYIPWLLRGKLLRHAEYAPILHRMFENTEDLAFSLKDWCSDRFHESFSLDKPT